jgi:hypothetical protein
MRSEDRWQIVVVRSALCLALLPAVVTLAIKPKGKKGRADDSGAAANTNQPDALPADLCMASLRVSAMDTLYQLDLSADQLASLRDAARGTAAEDPNQPATPNQELADLFYKMQSALLAGTDDATIASLRNQLITTVNARGIDLDDSIKPTASAHAAAAKAMDMLKASQLAAYIAAHADEVGDPIELMNNGVASMREAKAATETAADVDDVATETSGNVALLVAGMDGAKAAAVARQVAEWLKANAAANDADFEAGESKRDADARKIIGLIGPADVLTHWMQEQMAGLLSNPQTIRAIDLTMEHRKVGH